MHQKELRALVARMQDQVTGVKPGSVTEDSKRELSEAWDSLVSHLNLGPAPEMRSCPKCSRQIMKAATVCGFCWTKFADASGHA